MKIAALLCYVMTMLSSRHLKLSAEQKCDIAQRELEELREDIQKLGDESEKILDNFKVSQINIKIHLKFLIKFTNK
jgi:hypothetical protein